MIHFSRIFLLLFLPIATIAQNTPIVKIDESTIQLSPNGIDRFPMTICLADDTTLLLNVNQRELWRLTLNQGKASIKASQRITPRINTDSILRHQYYPLYPEYQIIAIEQAPVKRDFDGLLEFIFPIEHDKFILDFAPGICYYEKKR